MADVQQIPVDVTLDRFDSTMDRCTANISHLIDVPDSKLMSEWIDLQQVDVIINRWTANMCLNEQMDCKYVS